MKFCEIYAAFPKLTLLLLAYANNLVIKIIPINSKDNIQGNKKGIAKQNW